MNKINIKPLKYQSKGELVFQELFILKKIVNDIQYIKNDYNFSLGHYLYALNKDSSLLCYIKNQSFDLIIKALNEYNAPMINYVNIKLSYEEQCEIIKKSPRSYYYLPIKHPNLKYYIAKNHLNILINYDFEINKEMINDVINNIISYDKDLKTKYNALDKILELDLSYKHLWMIEKINPIKVKKHKNYKPFSCGILEEIDNLCKQKNSKNS